MHAGNEANHGIGGALPHAESQVHGTAMKEDVVINGEDSVGLQALRVSEPVVQTVFLVQIELEIHPHAALGILLRHLPQRLAQRIRRPIRLAPHDVDRFHSGAGGIVTHRLLEEVISFPCVDQNCVAAPVKWNLSVFILYTKFEIIINTEKKWKQIFLNCSETQVYINFHLKTEQVILRNSSVSVFLNPV